MTARRVPSLRSNETRNTPTPKVPVSLAKRLLFPNVPTGAEIPSLLSLDDHDLNAELYDFLALSLRGFVTPWWSKISKYDKEFLPEITRIVAVVLRSLEVRLALADLPSLLFKELPAVVSQHYIDHRSASSKVGTSYAMGGISALPQLFHQLQPHIAVSPEGHWDDIYLRQAVDHVLKACLPPQDWNAEAERSIIREVIVKVVLGSAFRKLSQPWFLQKVMFDLIGALPSPKPPEPPPSHHRPFSFQAFIVLLLSAVQTISGMCLAAITFNQRVVRTIRAINASTPLVNDPHRTDLAPPILHLLAVILTMRSRAAASSLLSLLELGIGFSRTFLNKALPYTLFTFGLNMPRLTHIVVLGKKNLFPNGYPTPPPPDPTPEEQIIIREHLEAQLLSLFPALLLGPDKETRRKTICDILDPLTSPECNVHLLLFLFDAILLALFPELSVSSGTTQYTQGDIGNTLAI